MSRMLVVAWPDWPVVAAGCRPEVPAAVVAANHVKAVTAAARAEGVTVGLRRREAQRRCPELEVMAADPGRDARCWEPVVAAVETLTPAVEVVRPGRLCLGTRGPSRYHGGDAALARLVHSVAEAAAGAAGCRVGVADGRFAATLAALTAGTVPAGAVCGGAVCGGAVVPRGRSREWLAPHPVAALGSGYGDLADLLVRLGIRTLGELAALSPAVVLGRFGPEGIAAHRLARGGDERPVAARTPPPDLACQAEFDPPEARVEAAAFVAKALADDLHGRLESSGLAASSVAIEVETEHGERLVRNWRHEGLLSASALSERTRWQLEGWLGGSGGPGVGGPGVGGPGVGGPGVGGPTGGLILLRLSPVEVVPDTGRQTGFWGQASDADRRASRALARVQGMLGPEAVYTAVAAGGRGCADQVRLVPWGDARPERPRDPPPWPGRLGRPSPAFVHQPPLAVEVLGGDGRPVAVSGRGLISTAPACLVWPGPGGRRCVVQAWAGPWPVEERWWEGDGRRRARVQLVLDDGSAHLVQREAGAWWVEASYG